MTSASIYPFELPTTGSFSFAEHFSDATNTYTSQLAEATQARANLRAALKESKRTDGEKDHLRIVKVLDDYIPYLYSVMGCVASGEITQLREPVFSWRTTLSSHLFNSSPRISLPSLPSELIFTLLTYAFALSNLARLSVWALGSYEYDRGISDVERKAKDEKLGFAVTLLTKASGVFAFVAETVLVEAEKEKGPNWLDGVERPPEMSGPVIHALSKLCLASAQALAIRKLLSKSAFDSTVTPGPPLPKSHPSPSLIAKLHLESSSLLASALSLARIPGSSKTRIKSPKLFSSKSNGEASSSQSEEMTVSDELTGFLSGSVAMHTAMAHKWLGVDAGENQSETKGGEAVGYLLWAKKEFEDIKDAGVKGGGKEEGKDGRKERKEKVVEELASVALFLRHYKKMNDSLYHLPVPPQSSLQSLIPTGRLAVAIKPFAKPTPTFGPGSIEHTRRQTEDLELAETENGEPPTTTPERSYSGAGSYF